MLCKHKLKAGSIFLNIDDLVLAQQGFIPEAPEDLAGGANVHVTIAGDTLQVLVFVNKLHVAADSL